jgi:hypothetical protein
MKDREYLLPLLLLAGAAFVLVSVLVFLSLGRNRRLLSAKMRIGAFLLSFSFFAVSLSGCRTCYEPTPPPNTLIIFQTEPDHHPGDTITGHIENRTYPYYSFELLDSTTSALAQNGHLQAKDGAFNDYSEYFYFVIDSAVPAGTYHLNVYGEITDQISKTAKLQEDMVKVVD